MIRAREADRRGERGGGSEDKPTLGERCPAAGDPDRCCGHDKDASTPE